jgi:hypothetical protein
MEPLRKAKIGIALAIAGVALAFVWWYSAGNLFQTWYRSHQISAVVFAALAVAPSVVFAVVGLVGYVIGRKDFWKMYSTRKGLLAVLGLAVMSVGGFFFGFAWVMSGQGADMSMQPLTQHLANNSPYFILFALWFVTGLLVFTDSIEAYWRKE